jgi:hypothetical protein
MQIPLMLESETIGVNFISLQKKDPVIMQLARPQQF